MGVFLRTYSSIRYIFHNLISRRNNSKLDNVKAPIESEYIKKKFSITDSSYTNSLLDLQSPLMGNRESNEALIRNIYDYSFLQSLVDAIEIPMTDVIRKSSWEISLHPAHNQNSKLDDSLIRIAERDIAEVLSQIDMSDFVKGELREWISFGFSNYYVYVDQNRTLNINKINDSNCYAIYNKNKYLGVEFNGDGNDGFINGKYVIPYFFEKKIVSSMTEEQAIKSKIINREIDCLSNKVIEFESVIGVGFLESVAKDLLNLYLREIVYDWLSMLEVVQPRLLSLTLDGDKWDTALMQKSAQNIEAMLNDVSSKIITSGMGGNNIFPVLMQMLANRFQVAPLTQGSSSLDVIDIFGLTEQLSQMQEDIDKRKLYILNNKSIPEEQYNGTGNRWEVISRTDKALDNIKNAASSIERFVKEFVFVIVQQLGYSDLIKSTDQIKFSLDVSALTSNYIETSGLSFLKEKLNQLEDLIGSVTSLLDSSDVIDEKVLKNYVFKNVKEFDPDLSNIIKYTDHKLSDEELEAVDNITEFMVKLKKE